MKRVLSAIGVVVVCLSLVGWGGDKGWQGQNKWKGPVYFQSNISASGHKVGVTVNVSTESNLTSAALAYGVISLEVGSARTIALANGVEGQMITLICTVKDVPDLVIQDIGLGAMTMTGWTSLTFDTLLDSITLLFVDSTVGWVVVGNAGVVIA